METHDAVRIERLLVRRSKEIKLTIPIDDSTSAYVFAMLEGCAGIITEVGVRDRVVLVPVFSYRRTAVGTRHKSCCWMASERLNVTSTVGMVPAVDTMECAIAAPGIAMTTPSTSAGQIFLISMLTINS